MDSACNVLCLNHGSSSLKFALYDMQRGDELYVATDRWSHAGIV